MSNHFHLLVRVPHRPEGFDVPLEVVLARLERAIGDKAMALVRTQLGLWTRSGLTEAIEEWRQRASRKREDGTVVRRGLSERMREQLTTASERRVRAEVLIRRVAHFTRGVMIGRREFVDGWFEANRSAVKGRSQLERKRGSRSLGRRALRGLYSLRDPRN